VQDASAFERGGGVPLFGVSGVGQASSAHHEPVQDASAFERYAAERSQRAARQQQTGAHRAPVQDGSTPVFGGPPRNGTPAQGSAPTFGVTVNPDPQGQGLFRASTTPTGAHRAPADGGSPSNGRTGPGHPESEPHRAPPSGANGAAAGGEAAPRGMNGTSRDGAVPTQRAGTEASGPSYQQAAGRRRRATGEGSSPFGPANPGAAGGDTAQPSYGRPAASGREGALPSRRPAEQAGGDGDPTPETTAFPVQHAPGADPAWGKPPPAGQDATMVASPGWLDAGQPNPAGPPGSRRARRGNPGEGRHGQPDAPRNAPPER